MKITPDELLTEAAQMALEIRLKDQAIAALQAEITRLRDAAGGPEPQPTLPGAFAHSHPRGHDTHGPVPHSPPPAGDAGTATLAMHGDGAP